jgi:hypothetical protein
MVAFFSSDVVRFISNLTHSKRVIVISLRFPTTVIDFVPVAIPINAVFTDSSQSPRASSRLASIPFNLQEFAVLG